MKNRSVGNIKKIKPGKYKIRISCGIDEFGKRKVLNKTVSAKSDTEAEKILMQLYNDRDSIYNDKATPITLNDLYNCWHDIHLKNTTPNTIAFYENLYKHIKPYSSVKLVNLNVCTVNKIVDAMPEGKIQNAVFKMIKAIINKGISWGYYNKANPCNNLTTPAYKPKEKTILSDNDLLIINDTIYNEPLKYQCIFYCAAILGMRRGEIAALTWDCINLEKNQLIINKSASLSHSNLKDSVIIKSTKTEASERKLYVPDILIKKFRELRAEQNIMRLKLGDIYNNRDYVFTQWNGNIINLHTISNWWKDYAKKNNITPGVTFHCLRHTAASVMIHAGIDIASVSHTLGHSNITTTLNTYTHFIEDSKKNAINTVADKYKAFN